MLFVYIIDLIVSRIVEQCHKTCPVVVHHGQTGRLKALIADTDSAVMDHILLGNRPLKRRISLHDISVEGQLRTVRLKGVRTDRERIVSGRRRMEGNVDQIVAACKRALADRCHGIADHNLLQLVPFSFISLTALDIFKNRILDRCDGIILDRDAYYSSGQIFVIETVRRNAGHLNLADLARNHQIDIAGAGIAICDRTGDQYTVAVNTEQVAAVADLVILLAVLHIHIRYDLGNCCLCRPGSLTRASLLACTVLRRSSHIEILVAHGAEQLLANISHITAGTVPVVRELHTSQIGTVVEQILRDRDHTRLLCPAIICRHHDFLQIGPAGKHQISHAGCAHILGYIRREGKR